MQTYTKKMDYTPSSVYFIVENELFYNEEYVIMRYLSLVVRLEFILYLCANVFCIIQA